MILYIVMRGRIISNDPDVLLATASQYYSENE